MYKHNWVKYFKTNVYVIILHKLNTHQYLVQTICFLSETLGARSLLNFGVIM